jgi:hypothetical protein
LERVRETFLKNPLHDRVQRDIFAEVKYECGVNY